MVLANVDSIVAADRIDGREGLLILYKLLILVSRTAARTYLISLCYHVSSPQLCTRQATTMTMSTRQASTTQRAKRCKKVLLHTKTR